MNEFFAKFFTKHGHFIKKIVWNALKSLLFGIAGLCLLITFMEETHFYFRFAPHALCALGFFADYKASKSELWGQWVKSAEGPKSFNAKIDTLRVNLHRKVAGLIILAGLMARLELVGASSKISQGESVNHDILSTSLSVILLLLGIVLFSRTMGSTVRR
ncbi:MAG: hypothetical protein KBB54_00730 [Candidatus Pacebacteria bacterium]|nr:hypothetical protein [Candidatus Paceibacterota bacterium]MBP9818555.1 hypothetical protein [Candidatus Paceibacterota bacterium]